MSRKNSKKQTIELSPVRTRSAKGKDEDVTQRVVAQVSTEFNSRFSRLEKAIEALAIANKPAEVATNKRKRQPDLDDDQVQSRPKPKRPPSAAAARPTPVINLEMGQVQPVPSRSPASPAIAEPAQWSAPHHLAQKPVTSRYPPQQEAQPQHVNKSRWSSWMVNNMNTGREDSIPLPLSARDISPDDDVHAKVQEVLNSTASRAMKVNKTGEFPYQYILRGAEKKKVGINSVSLPEHIWGIICMIKDNLVANDVKPALLEHIEQICDDCREYDWPSAVRRWSEEIFSLIAENRLEAGWHSVNAIQMLRFSLSRDSNARIHAAREQVPRPRQYNQTSEALCGGPPCPDFNSQKGCSQPSGHLAHGKRLMHICSFCLMNSAATYPHPEAACRNKSKISQTHFH